MPRILVDVGPLRKYPYFRRLWCGYALRQVGAQITVTTVIWQVYKITHSNLDVGLISIAQVVPGVISPILGGAIADAIDRRILLLITAVLMAASTTGLALNSMGRHPAIWVLYVCSSVTWALNGVDSPTRRAVIITLVERDSYVTANTLTQFLSQFSQFGGPAMAGLLIGFFPNLSYVYWVDVASTVMALQSVLRLPSMPPIGGRKVSVGSIIEGFRYFKGRRVIQACFITDINATLLGLPTSLYPYMATVHFHGGPRTFALLAAAPALGNVVGGVFSGWTSRLRYQGRAILFAVGVWGFAIAGFGLVPWLALGVVLLACAGWANQVSSTMRQTIIQVETPDNLRGRISSLSTISAQIGKLGSAEAGLVAAVSSVQTSIVSGGLGSVLGVVVIAKMIPSFARYRLDVARAHSEEEVKVFPELVAESSAHEPS